MTTKKIFLVIILFTVTAVLFGEDLEYVTIRKTMLYDNGTASLNKSRDVLLEIDKGIKVKHSVRPHMYKDTNVDVNGEEIILGTFIYNNAKYFINCADLVPANTINKFAPSFISDLNSNTRKTWVPAYYIKVLQSLNRDTILILDKHWREYDPDWRGIPDMEIEWYEQFWIMFPCNELIIYNSVLLLNPDIGMMIKNINKTNNGYVVTVKFSQNDWEKFKYDDLNWDHVKGKEFFNMIFHIDGEYMDVYLDDIKHKLTTFALVDQLFLRELKLLVENKKADLSKVHFPHRADGSMDDDPLPELLSDIELFKIEDKMPEAVIETENQTKAITQNNADKTSLSIWAWFAIIGGAVVVVGGGTVVFALKRK
jgi:hypothetical protein